MPLCLIDASAAICSIGQGRPEPSTTQVLYDVGAVSTPEPFQRLVSQGMILGEVEYTAHRGPDGAWAHESHPEAVPVR